MTIPPPPYGGPPPFTQGRLCVRQNSTYATPPTYFGFISVIMGLPHFFTETAPFRLTTHSPDKTSGLFF